ncbi:MAG: sigma-70 family RNA polymerase sigma factor [Armatimonadetes bacterium]|nr:sigma-70 family RNA polymerase sigma factor [Armatimonadota bacterium]
MDPKPSAHDLAAVSLLAQRARAGDRAAFDRLAAEYRRVLYALARRNAPDADPDGLVQEILLRAWEKLPGLRDPCAFPAWLTRLALNLCRRRGTQASRRPLSLDEEMGGGWVSPAPDPLDLLLRRERSAEVRDALLAIPEANRRALILHLWGQYSYAEIAARVGVPITTVEGRIHRAKAQLRQRLDFLDPRPRSAPSGETHMARRAKSRTTEHPELVPQFGHPTGIQDLAVSPDGKRLATVAVTGMVILWNVENGQQEARISVLTSARTPVFSPDGRWLAVPDGFRRTLLVDVRRGKVARLMEARAWCAAFSPDSAVLYGASWLLAPGEEEELHASVNSYVVTTGKVLHRVEGLPGYGVLLSADGSRLVTVTGPPLKDGAPQSPAERLLHVWSLPSAERVSILRGLVGYPHSNAVALSPDSKMVAAATCYAGPSRDLLVWEADTGRLLHTFGGFTEESPVYALAFHPHEPFLVSADEAWRVRDSPPPTTSAPPFGT